MRRSLIFSVLIMALLVLPGFAENDSSKSLIKKAVKNQLMWDSRVNEENVKVSVDDTKVTLTGIVDSATAVNVAEVNAWQVPGVYEVDNLLIVSYDKNFTLPTDKQLSDRITSLIGWSSIIAASDINILVDDGKVTLEGSVPTLWQKLKAKELALDVLGVYDVQNELAIVPEKEFEDQFVADIVVDAIDREHEVDISNVNVYVDDGVVTLNGLVEDQRAIEAAVEATIYSTGVLAINNNLLIESK